MLYKRKPKHSTTAENLTLNFFVLKKRWQKKLKRKRLPAQMFLRSGKVAMEDNELRFRKVCFSQTLLKSCVMQVRQLVRWLGFIYFLKLFRRGFFFLLITF